MHPLTFATSCVLALGCSYYDTSLLLTATASDAASDSQVDDEPVTLDTGAPTDSSTHADSADETCRHADPPSRPTVSDAGGNMEVIVAFRSVTLDAAGFDIDHTCTCQGQNDSCRKPSWATADSCDALEGRDNAAASLFQEASKLISDFKVESWNEQLDKGAWSVLLRIRGYNGLADDDQVDVAWYNPDAFDAGLSPMDGGTPAPRWDGTDDWPIQDSCLGTSPAPDGGLQPDLNKPKTSDPNAYVSGGRLVANVRESVLKANPTMSLVLTDVVLSGRLAQSSAGWEIQDGQVAGLWTLQSIFEGLTQIAISGMPLCTDSLFYGSVKRMVCKYADVHKDHAATQAECDSVSAGIGFHALPAGLGRISMTPAGAKQCAPPVDPSTDSCTRE